MRDSLYFYFTVRGPNGRGFGIAEVLWFVGGKGISEFCECRVSHHEPPFARIYTVIAGHFDV